MNSRCSTYRTTRTNGRSRPVTQTNRSGSRRQITLMEGAIVILCTFAVVLTFSRAIAEPAHGDVSSVPVRVEASQTLWSLAGEHPIEGMTTAQTVEYIQLINELESSNLRVGEVVLVPQAQDLTSAMASK